MSFDDNTNVTTDPPLDYRVPLTTCILVEDRLSVPYLKSAPYLCWVQLAVQHVFGLQRIENTFFGWQGDVRINLKFTCSYILNNVHDTCKALLLLDTRRNQGQQGR
ncbi:hypothetical protein PISMIDRAFT_176478 [Pisolithus microcarpus 441]|uniref:Uncharacterized protein n=1 Tax=Pisolithus microcarpus 441 TaxID=765257 RepID=A0A0C9Z8U7_9AGAM|nr:hypothetical protein PISMIDRAFT_176478 [Pisolithus microcarpus 441]